MLCQVRLISLKRQDKKLYSCFLRYINFSVGGGSEPPRMVIEQRNHTSTMKQTKPKTHPQTHIKNGPPKIVNVSGFGPVSIREPLTSDLICKYWRILTSRSALSRAPAPMARTKAVVKNWPYGEGLFSLNGARATLMEAPGKTR